MKGLSARCIPKPHKPAKVCHAIQALARGLQACNQERVVDSVQLQFISHRKFGVWWCVCVQCVGVVRVRTHVTHTHIHTRSHKQKTKQIQIQMNLYLHLHVHNNLQLHAHVHLHVHTDVHNEKTQAQNNTDTHIHTVRPKNHSDLIPWAQKSNSNHVNK